MRRTLTVLVVALVASPVSAGQPTPTQVAEHSPKAREAHAAQPQGKQAHPTRAATPEPVGSVNLNSSRSNRVGQPNVTMRPSMAPVPVGSVNLNSSRSNYRVGQPTVTKTPSSRSGKPAKEQ